MISQKPFCPLKLKQEMVAVLHSAEALGSEIIMYFLTSTIELCILSRGFYFLSEETQLFSFITCSHFICVNIKTFFFFFVFFLLSSGLFVCQYNYLFIFIFFLIHSSTYLNLSFSITLNTYTKRQASFAYMLSPWLRVSYLCGTKFGYSS